MSYSRTFSTPVTLRYSGIVDGKPYSGSVTETINVNVHVDTSDFEDASDANRASVDALTGAVVATKAAHVQSITDMAGRIGSTLIAGFYSTVKSEISQQMTQLTGIIDATTVHLAELSKRCNDKQRQMAADYARLESRYSKLFGELDSELDNRVHELDRNAFNTFRAISDVTGLAIDSDSAATVAVAGSETSRTRTLIEASSVKNTAARAIGAITGYLVADRQCDRLIDRATFPAGGATFACPVLAVETTAPGAPPQRSLYTPPPVKPDDRLLDYALSASAAPASCITPDVEQAFNSMLSATVNPADSRSRRVAELAARMFNQSKNTKNA